MRRALELALEARGTTSQNPPVGAVVVREGEIVGEGYTSPPGGPHAERVALTRARNAARSASLYVTLEPCSHWGRTPPCTDAIIEAGIAEVHVATVDPNPLVAGSGLRILREHQIVVIEEPDPLASELIEPHTMYSLHERPFVTMAIDAVESLYAMLLATSDVELRNEPMGIFRGNALRQPELLSLRPGDISPDTGRLLHTWRDVFADRPSTSCLLTVFSPARLDPLYLGLSKEELIDKVVTSTEAEVPAGFTILRRRHLPVPHVVAYPDHREDH